MIGLVPQERHRARGNSAAGAVPAGAVPAEVRARKVVAVVSGLAVACLSGPLHGQERSEYVHNEFVDVQGVDGSLQRAHVIYPRLPDGRRAPAGGRYPVVVALHGRGEAAKGVRRGALGWYVDYRLHQGFRALLSRRVDSVDLLTFGTEQHIARINRELIEKPFTGVMVVAPYVPDLTGLTPDDPEFQRYMDWLAGPLLSAVREQYPQAARTREGTGIDGVSMGGMVALETGLAHPEVFGAVGAIQPALSRSPDEIAQAAMKAGLDAGVQHLRLLSSERDPLLESTQGLSTAFREARVPHRLLVVPGPHNIAFNRGPGSLELLRFAASVLVQEPAEGAPE